MKSVFGVDKESKEMKRVSQAQRKGGESPENTIKTFPINLLGSKSKGWVFHHCGSNLYSVNSTTISQICQGFFKNTP